MSPDPATHRCTIGTLDYSLVEHGSIRCARERGGCGRRWTWIDPSLYESGGVGWQPSPRPLAALRRGSRREVAPAVPLGGGEGPW